MYTQKVRGILTSIGGLFGAVIFTTGCSEEANLSDPIGDSQPTTEEIQAQQGELNSSNLPVVTGAPSPLNTFSWQSTTSSTTNTGASCTDEATSCCRECSWGPESVLSAPMSAHTSLESWVNSIPMLGGSSHLRDALLGGVVAGANAQLASSPGSKSNNLESFFSAAESVLLAGNTLGHTVFKTVDPEESWVFSFAPQYGRFLKKQLLPPSGCNNCSAIWHTYAEPEFLEEEQFRGARSYCAMNTAAQQLDNADAYLMASKSLGNWAGFGVGSVAPSVKILSPSVAQTPSGAEAFAIPIVLGGQLNPISGPVAKLPEIAHPLVWVTGDAEVLSQEDFGPATQRFCPPSGCVSLSLNTYRKRFRNVQHVDAIAGRSVKGSMSIDGLSVMSMGGVGVSGTLGLSAELGQRIGHQMLSGQVWYAPSTGIVSRSSAPDLGLPVWASDAPLGLCDPGRVCPYEGSSPLSYLLWGTLGIGYRISHQDDRAMVVRDKVTETFVLSGSLPLIPGPFLHISASVSGELSATASQTFIFREHISLAKSNLVQQGFPFPSLGQSNVIITPEVSSSASATPINITATQSFNIPFIGFVMGAFTIYKSESFTLASLPVTLASEAHRLRVGEYSIVNSVHDGLNDGPPSYSHLPNSSAGLTDTSASGAQFASFPSGSTVASCLGSPAFDDSNVPGPAPGSPAVPLSYELCYEGFETPRTLRVSGFGGTNSVTLPPMPLNVCSNIAGYVSGLSSSCGTGCDFSAQQKCLSDMLAFLCGGTSKTQAWGTSSKNFNVVSRVRNASSPAATDQTFSNITSACIDAFAGSASEAQLFLEGFTRVHACSSNGTLVGQKVD